MGPPRDGQIELDDPEAQAHRRLDALQQNPAAVVVERWRLDPLRLGSRLESMHSAATGDDSRSPVMKSASLEASKSVDAAMSAGVPQRGGHRGR